MKIFLITIAAIFLSWQSAYADGLRIDGVIRPGSPVCMGSADDLLVYIENGMKSPKGKDLMCGKVSDAEYANDKKRKYSGPPVTILKERPDGVIFVTVYTIQSRRDRGDGTEEWRYRYQRYWTLKKYIDPWKGGKVR